MNNIRKALLLTFVFMSLLGMSNIAFGQFSDDFNRSDSEVIGNGWIEKNPNAFSLIGNAVVSNPAALVNERDNIVYRPSSEDLLDVEASVEFRLMGSSPGYPQVHVRVQSDTVAQMGNLEDYELWVVNNNSQASLGRQPYPYAEGSLAIFSINPPLNTVDRFRLRLRAIGTDPVELEAFVERFDGTNWQVIGQAVVTDASDDRISSAGSVGFGGYNGTNCQYDNFAYTNLLSE